MKTNKRIKCIPKRNSKVRKKLLRNFLVEGLIYLNNIKDGKSTERKAKTAVELRRDRRPGHMLYGKPDKELTMNASVKGFTRIKVPWSAYDSCSSGCMGEPFVPHLWFSVFLNYF